MRYQLYRTILRQSAFKPQFFRFQQYQRTAMSSKVSPPRIANPALFICDIQERFQKAIYQFPSVVTTTLKLLSAAKTLQIPVYITTQNKRALGDTVPEILALAKETNLIINADKSLFSMCTQEVLDKLDENTGEGGEKREVIVVGIESHICLMQTTLDLLERGHKVWVVRDGVSSCNPQEISTALARMQQAGAVITTSESFLFECMKDSARPEFKTIAGLVKETKASTKECLEALVGPVGAQESGGISKL